jgi:hypothetical protein
LLASKRWIDCVFGDASFSPATFLLIRIDPNVAAQHTKARHHGHEQEKDRPRLKRDSKDASEKKDPHSKHPIDLVANAHKLLFSDLIFLGKEASTAPRPAMRLGKVTRTATQSRAEHEPAAI